MSDMFEKVARMAGKVVQMEEKRTQVEADRANYAATVQHFRETGYWSEAELAEYATDAGRIMRNGTMAERLAASEFWAAKAAENGSNSAMGINDRIRASIAQEKAAEMKEAA